VFPIRRRVRKGKAKTVTISTDPDDSRADAVQVCCCVHAYCNAISGRTMCASQLADSCSSPDSSEPSDIELDDGTGVRDGVTAEPVASEPMGRGEAGLPARGTDEHTPALLAGREDVIPTVAAVAAVPGGTTQAGPFASADTMARLRDLRTRAAAAAEMLAAEKASALRGRGAVQKHGANCVRVVKGVLEEVTQPETRAPDGARAHDFAGVPAAASDGDTSSEGADASDSETDEDGDSQREGSRASAGPSGMRRPASNVNRRTTGGASRRCGGDSAGASASASDDDSASDAPGDGTDDADSVDEGTDVPPGAASKPAGRGTGAGRKMARRSPDAIISPLKRAAKGAGAGVRVPRKQVVPQRRASAARRAPPGEVVKAARAAIHGEESDDDAVYVDEPTSGSVSAEASGRDSAASTRRVRVTSDVGELGITKAVRTLPHKESSISVHTATVKHDPRDILRATKSMSRMGPTIASGPQLGRVVKAARGRLAHRRHLRDDGGESGEVASPYRLKWLSAQIAAVYFAREQALRQASARSQRVRFMITCAPSD
jgi:hypothetical protein